MSYRNLKLSPWTHPRTGELRLYIGTRFCDPRNHGLPFADGCWIYERDGKTRFGCKPADGGFAEDRALALEYVAELLGAVDLNDRFCLAISMAELVERVSQCNTKGGNFSYPQYEKKFNP